MNKYIYLIFLLLVFGLNACQKDDAGEASEGNKKNLYRVKEIAGTNDAWGEFRLVCSYVNEKLDSAVCYDAEGEMIGKLMTSYSGANVNLYWYDKVVSVSPDSVAKLDPDSIPYVLQPAAHWEFRLNGDLIKQEIVAYYGPRELPEEAEFDYTYELKDEMKYLYEYDAWGRPLYLRVLNLIDGEQLPHKYVFLYEQDRPVGYIEQEYQEEQWKEVRKLSYEWQGGQICCMAEYVMNEEWELKEKGEFKYNGRYPAQLITTEGTVSYSFDGNGNLTYWQQGNRSFTIKYEAGHGNFSLLEWPRYLLTAEPQVK